MKNLYRFERVKTATKSAAVSEIFVRAAVSLENRCREKVIEEGEGNGFERLMRFCVDSPADLSRYRQRSFFLHSFFSVISSGCLPQELWNLLSAKPLRRHADDRTSFPFQTRRKLIDGRTYNTW